MTVIPNPKGISIFGGVAPFVRRSADNTIYVIYCGERPGAKFGTHIYRVLPNNNIEWVDYAPFTESRVDAEVRPDGLYISYAINRDTQPIEVKIPGFVCPPYPGGTNFPPPTPVNVLAIDETARASANNALAYAQLEVKNLKKEIEKLKKELAAVAARPVAVAFDEQRVNDHAWAKAGERLYAELADPNSPISNLVRELATGKR